MSISPRPPRPARRTLARPRSTASVAFIVLFTGLVACGSSSGNAVREQQGSTAPLVTETVVTDTVSGSVISLTGSPIVGAQIRVLGTAGEAVSGPDGTFRVPTPTSGWAQNGVWVSVRRDGFLSRTTAAAVGRPVLVRLTPDDGKTISIHLAGDVMFGRRFYDPNEDGDTSDGLLQRGATVADYLALLANIRPLLADADVSVVNLETPLIRHPYFRPTEPRPDRFHPTKDYAFASSPAAAQALARAGVDVVDIGNNHLYDALGHGVSSTLTALTDAGFASGQGRFGGGRTEREAWQPAYVHAGNQTIAFLGCTAEILPFERTGPVIAGRVHGHFVRNAISYVASGNTKGGAAACDERRIERAVTQAKAHADLVVFMVHDGTEYWRAPTATVRRMSQAAHRAGAALVVDGHPHVVSGFSLSPGSLTAWSMGNFVFDQIVWPAFESYLLDVDVRDGKVIRAYTEPIMVQDFVPEGVTGSLADYVARGAAGWEPVPSAIEGGIAELDVAGRAVHRTMSSRVGPTDADGTIFRLGPGSWVSDFSGDGQLELGRDLLWVGSFEDEDVDATPAEAPLWNFETGAGSGPSYAYEGSAGARLTRHAGDCYDALLSPTHRILVEPGKHLSVIGMARIPDDAVAQVQLSWYLDRKGSSFSRSVHTLPTSGGRWEPFRIDATVPPRTVAVGLYLRLVPPKIGSAYADFDNLALVGWAPAGSTTPTPVYDYALLRGRGTVAIRNDVLPGGPAWDRTHAFEAVAEGAKASSPTPAVRAVSPGCVAGD